VGASGAAAESHGGTSRCSSRRPRADLPSRPHSVGVPGAFTPPCSSHVPGYVQNEDKFLAKGIKEIYVVAVNDAFCTKAWKKELGAEGSKVHFL
jgi:2-Cys peroxiredoxin 5